MPSLHWKGRRAYAVHYHQGKLKWHPLGKFSRKVDAHEAFVKHLKINQDEGTKEAQLKDLDPQFWSFYQSTHEKVTTDGALNHWKVIKDEFGEDWIHTIDAKRIEEFKASKDWAVATWKIRLVLLKQFIQYAKDHGFRTSNPFATIKIKQKKLHEYMPEYRPWPEVVQLLEYMQAKCKEPNYLAAKLMAYSGMRPIELSRITEQDIEPGRIRVTGKKKTRWIPLHPQLQEILDKLPFEFNHDAFHSSLQRACRKLWDSYNHFTPKTLRHSFATELLRRTKNLRLVGQVLGQSTLQVTARYAWVLDDEQKAGVEMLD